jgi:chromosome partitioning protein
MTIGVSNLKGGVGKTTIAQNLAVCLAHLDYKVCIIDTDTNQNSMEWYEARSEDLPAIMVASVTDKGLSKTVKTFSETHDFIIIDGTPSLADIATRIILASDILLIPMLPSAHDFRTLKLFFERYEQALEFRDSIPAYFVLNQYNPRVKLDREIFELLKGQNADILETTLKKRVVYKSAAVDGMGAYEYDDPKAKMEMFNLTKEVLGLVEKLG